MIRIYEYSPDKGLTISDKPHKNPAPNGCVWVDISSPDQGEVKVLQEVFGFHPLAVEDCINVKQRSKLDDYRDYFFVVLHSVADSNPGNRLNIRELSMFVGHDYLVTFHWDQVMPVDSVWERVGKNPDLMARGIDYVLYLVLDTVVDEYFPVLDHIDDRFSSIEARLLNNPGGMDIQELSRLKRSLVEMRKILSPHRETVNALIRYEGTFIRDENKVFYLDVYDHLMRIFDFLETYRDLISGSLEVYLTVISNRMNEKIKTLTLIATVTMPLTLISSIYGMNFQNMPELSWRFGYQWALGLMAATTMGMMYYFKRKKWF